MEESTIIMDPGAIARGQCESALETILREGGRRLLQEALELEVQQYIERFQQLKSESGQGLVVRNGYHQERELVTGAGKVPVRQPRVHDRRPTEHFTSAILPPYLRRTPSIDALIPALCLKGVSTSAFAEALQAILGDGVVGLSAHNVVRLKQVWEQEFPRPGRSAACTASATSTCGPTPSTSMCACRKIALACWSWSAPPRTATRSCWQSRTASGKAISAGCTCCRT